MYFGWCGTRYYILLMEAKKICFCVFVSITDAVIRCSDDVTGRTAEDSYSMTFGSRFRVSMRMPFHYDNPKLLRYMNLVFFRYDSVKLVHSLNQISWKLNAGDVMSVELEPAMQKGVTLVTPRYTAAVILRFLSNTLMVNMLSQSNLFSYYFM
ncbi:hypothetical protein T4E_11696 [Trichinella pseudospiralis]|uniref:Uncharacterized protein n=1 Tax=Trichinella pseudospiralis TaxID=6337 RepID=A0A0V0YG29_TRIPS|nr:hypothetical protein T4E_11696 [Trichinella pseudospiralis]